MINIYLKTFLISAFIGLSSFGNAQTYSLKFKTNYGNFEAILYDYTPKHRDLILNEIKKGTYKNAEFNRVIKDFVIQGGELDDSILNRETQNPNQTIARLEPEFNPKAFHKVGALGAGRDNNPSKGSYFNQIYIVVGKPVNLIDLESFEIKKGIKFTKEQKDEYLKNGGLPRLDQDYTVFGEITKNLDNAIKISNVKTNKDDIPEKPVIFTIKVKKNNPQLYKKHMISVGAGFSR